MRRREILKTVPLSLAGGLAMRGQPASRGLAEIRIHNGAPTLFVDGQPSFAGLYWVSTPGAQAWESAGPSRLAAGAGVHSYAFEAGSGVEWTGPRPGRSSPFDFSTVAERFGRILETDPQARFHLRCHLEIGAQDWWARMYPSEMELDSAGRRTSQSFASELWRRQAKEFLEAYAAHLRGAGLLERVIAFQVGAGHTGEWVKGETSMYGVCGDYSVPMQARFRSWLRRRYGNDVAALRSAWNDPAVSFDTAGAPAVAEQLQARGFTFRDPRSERKVIDYYRCLADLCAELVIDFCRTVKEATGGTKLAGAFYGYLMELAWNGGFFKERPLSEYSTYQRSGHLGLRQVLQSPYVDFLVSPYSYGFRGIGGDGPSMLPAESVRLHGKLCLVEDDTRTHVDTDENYGRAASLRESTAILRRNFAQVAARGQGVWWASWKVDPAKEPAFRPMLQRFQELGSRLLETDRTPASEIAVLIDDESFLYESDRNALDVPLIFQQRLWGLPRTGAAFDTYLLQDLIDGRVPPYKLYIFLNSFRLDSARREGVRRQVCRDGRVALWIYASGYIDEQPSLEHIRDLTGFTVGASEQAWGPLAHITNFRHPITRALPQDLSWGTNNNLAPLFFVNDTDAEVLGQVVYSQGNCRPGFAVKRFPVWTSIYSAAPNLPAPLLRGVARFAGVHLYSEDGDVLHASRHLLAVHTVSGGERTFRLPARVEEVYDLFEQKTIARDTGVFQTTLPPVSTALYFTGPRKLLG